MAETRRPAEASLRPVLGKRELDCQHPLEKDDAMAECLKCET